MKREESTGFSLLVIIHSYFHGPYLMIFTSILSGYPLLFFCYESEFYTNYFH